MEVRARREGRRGLFRVVSGAVTTWSSSRCCHMLLKRGTTELENSGPEAEFRNLVEVSAAQQRVRRSRWDRWKPSGGGMGPKKTKKHQKISVSTLALQWTDGGLDEIERTEKDAVSLRSSTMLLLASIGKNSKKTKNRTYQGIFEHAATSD